MRWVAVPALLAAGLAGLGAGRADDVPGGDEWKYDVVVRTGGREPLEGLVTQTTPEYVEIKCITRKPGRPTLVFTERIARADVKRLELLGPLDWVFLTERFEALRRERQLLRRLDPKAKGAGSADVLALKSVAWVDGRGRAREYDSTYFRLVSNARPEVVRLAAVHLEQVYAAYARMLPPRVDKAKPTMVLLARSLADYHDLAKKRGLNLFNPAFYDPGHNEVVCGSDLARLGGELAAVRARHDELLKELRQRRAKLREVYKGKVPPELVAPLNAAETRIRVSEGRNADAFARVRERLFRRLFHEAFHAYLGTFVYPGKETFPRWFNEGLAQVFETAIVEAGELRVGHVDRERLKELDKAKLLPLTKLLRSGRKDFVVEHEGDKQVSDQHYLTSWALAYYLTFDRKLLGTKKLDKYVDSLGRGNDPVEAFQTLVGEPLGDFEKAWHQYLKTLGPAGPIKARAATSGLRRGGRSP
jgi:hypothetical protein